MSPADLSRREPTPAGETEATAPELSDLAELEVLDEQMPPAPWVVSERFGPAVYLRDAGGLLIETFYEPDGPRFAEQIAALRNAAPSLFAAVRAVERVRALCDEYRANCDPASVQAQVAELFRAALDGSS